jgi:hypothetical protein
VVLATAAALSGLARGRDTLAGLAAGAGIAVKLFPVLLLPAALRRPRFLVACAVVLAAAFAAVSALAPLEAPIAWLGRVAGFVDDKPMPMWERHAPALVMAMWRARVVGLGIPTLAAAAWAARRPSTNEVAVATGGLLAAWGGTVMAGSQLYHEALVLYPATGLLLAWPAVEGPRRAQIAVCVATIAVLVLGGAMSTTIPPNSIHQVPMGWMIWALSAVRWAMAVRGARTASA